MLNLHLLWLLEDPPPPYPKPKPPNSAANLPTATIEVYASITPPPNPISQHVAASNVENLMTHAKPTASENATAPPPTKSYVATVHWQTQIQPASVPNVKPPYHKGDVGEVAFVRPEKFAHETTSATIPTAEESIQIDTLQEVANDLVVTANPIQVVEATIEVVPNVSMHTSSNFVDENESLASRGTVETNFNASDVDHANEILEEIAVSSQNQGVQLVVERASRVSGQIVKGKEVAILYKIFHKHFGEHLSFG
ncbi:hypothetical protein Q3G72_022573 [Acer saccharum]|nr:hypothetical protein Q3G72_022573 [Acer saccharum]